MPTHAAAVVMDSFERFVRGDASRSRDLAIEIWYPIPPGATDGEDAEYAL